MKTLSSSLPQHALDAHCETAYVLFYRDQHAARTKVDIFKSLMAEAILLAQWDPEETKDYKNLD